MIDLEKLRNTPVTFQIEVDMFTLFVCALSMHTTLNYDFTQPVQVVWNGQKVTIPPYPFNAQSKNAVHGVAEKFMNEVLDFYVNQRKNNSPN